MLTRRQLMSGIALGGLMAPLGLRSARALTIEPMPKPLSDAAALRCTANIDTVTEKLLENILDRLPSTTTRVIIAHRLNTIENADEIFFVNAGEVTRAGSFNDAVNKLLKGKLAS